MRIDLIIPFFNDEKGLVNTIMSVGNYFYDVDITIVNDCSTKLTPQFSTVIQSLSLLTGHPIKVLATSKNVGPGAARQFGIDNTNNELIVFIDCGDVFYTPFSLCDMYVAITDRPTAQVISFAHFSDTINGLEYINPNHNRVGGKIYRREFLNKYHITFNNNSANEDIHFNMNCRTICQQIERNTSVQAFYMFDEAKTIWIYDENSITRKNNHAFFYKEQNMGAALSALHSIKNLQENNIDLDLQQEYIYTVFIYMYFSFLFTSIKHPEYIEESLYGVLIFYIKCINLNPINTDIFSKIYWDELSAQTNDPNSELKITIPSLSIFDFIKLLEEKKENYNDTL